MHKIELSGIPSEIQRNLKTSIESYIEKKKQELILNESEVKESIHIENIDSKSIIKYNGHTLIFHTIADIELKLPKLFLMLKAPHADSSTHHGACMNCDKCRCKK